MAWCHQATSHYQNQCEPWNLAWNCLPKEIRLCDEIEAFKRNLKTHLFVKFVNESTLAVWFWRIIVKRPRMLSAQFVALYKPCKPKPKPKPSPRGNWANSFWPDDTYIREFTHWGRDKKATTLQTFPYAFSWMKLIFNLKQILIELCSLVSDWKYVNRG